MSLRDFLGNVVDKAGTTLRMPEWGISEALANGNTVNSNVDSGYNLPNTTYGPNLPVYGPANTLNTNEDNSDPNANLPAADTGGVIDSGPSDADIAAQGYYTNQINQLNALLGLSPGHLETALGTLGKNYATKNTDLANQRTRTMNDYGVQRTENAQDKQRGVEGVGSFVNNSYNSLMRLLSGAGAGNSSVARTVIPTLVSKAGSTRRAGVFDTAGRNEQAITSAQTDAENQYTDEEKALAEWKRQGEGSLKNNSVNQDVSTLRDIQSAEYAREQAGGAAAGGETQNKINDRMAQLNSLFGAYQPNYTPKTMSLKAPSLSKFTVDPGEIRADQNLPQESRYYLPQISKRKQLEQQY